YKSLISKGINISRRSVFNAWDAFRRIIDRRNDQTGWKVTKERIAREGTMILAIDDLWAHQKYWIGAKTVLIIRECLTSEILDIIYPGNVINDQVPYLVDRIRSVTKEFRFPIHSVVFSERSRWIGQACMTALPGSPQLCYPEDNVLDPVDTA